MAAVLRGLAILCNKNHRLLLGLCELSMFCSILLSGSFYVLAVSLTDLQDSFQFSVVPSALFFFFPSSIFPELCCFLDYSNH